MPIKLAVEERDEFSLIVYRFSGHCDPAEALAAASRGLGQVAPERPYRELLIFEHDTDLSDFDPQSLATLYGRVDDLCRERKLGLRAAAAVLDDSVDARLIMPLYNAFARLGGGGDLSFELFADVGPALKRLGIPPHEGLKIVNRTA